VVMLPRLSDVMILMKRLSDSIVTFDKKVIFCHENHDLSVNYCVCHFVGSITHIVMCYA